MKIEGFSWKTFIPALLVVFLAGFVGTVYTSDSVNSVWYSQIKPSITPLILFFRLFGLFYIF